VFSLSEWQAWTDLLRSLLAGFKNAVGSWVRLQAMQYGSSAAAASFGIAARVCLGLPTQAAFPVVFAFGDSQNGVLVASMGGSPPGCLGSRSATEE
jgi:hypothetical protein